MLPLKETENHTSSRRLLTEQPIGLFTACRMRISSPYQHRQARHTQASCHEEARKTIFTSEKIWCRFFSYFEFACGRRMKVAFVIQTSKKHSGNLILEIHLQRLQIMCLRHRKIIQHIFFGKYKLFLTINENGNQKTVFKTAVWASKDVKKKIVNLNKESDKNFVS